MAPEAAAIFVFGDTVADEKTLAVCRNGVALELEPKAIRVLFYLIRHRDRVVPKDELITEIWAGAFVTDNALTRVVAQIRKQLGDNARSPRFIETSATTGYRFIAEVREGEAAARPLPRAMPKWKPVAAGAIAGAFALAWWLVQSGTGAPVRLAGLRQITTSPAADLWPTFSPDGSRIAFSSSRSGAFEIYVRSLGSGGSDTPVTSDGQENIQPAWSPDGRYLAYVARRHGGIAVIPVAGGTPRYLTDQGDTPAWSPDGRNVAFRASSLDLNPAIETTGIPGTTIWIVGADGSSMRALTRPGSPEGGHNFPRWSGSDVVFSALRPWSVDVKTGKLEEIRIAAAVVRSAVVSPDGRQLFYVDAGGGAPGLWHAPLNGRRAGSPEVLVPSPGTSPRDLAISTDGKRLAFSQQVGESAIWSVALKPDGTAAGDPQPLIRERSLRNAEPAFSPDGASFAYSSLRQGGEVAVYLSSAGGTPPHPVTAPDQISGRPSWLGATGTLGYRASRKGEWSYWLLPPGGKPSRQELKLDLRYADRMKLSPDGTKLAAHVPTPAGLQVVVEDLATHAIRRLTPAEGNFGFPSWSRDGRWIAAQDRAGGRNAIVYLPADGGEIRRLNIPMSQAMAHDWSPDSNRIAFAGLLDGVWNIYWVSRETGQVQQLTHFTSRSGFVRYPAWSPKNDRVVFEHNDLSANIYLADLR